MSYVVVTQDQEDVGVLGVYGPFATKRAAFTWAKRDAFETQKEFMAGEGYTDAMIRKMMHVDSESVGYEDGMTWVISKMQWPT